MNGRLGFDVDGVVRDFVGSLCKIFIKKGYKIVNPNTYYFTKMFNLNKEYEDFYDFLDDNLSREELEQLYIGSPVLSFVKENVDSLISYGFEVYYISHQISEEARDLTYKFMENNNLQGEKTIFTSGIKSDVCNKYGIDLFVDDLLTNYIDILYNSKTVPILFTGYNQNVKDLNIDYTTNNINRLKALGVPILEIDSHLNFLKKIENSVLYIPSQFKKKTYLF